MQEIFLNYGVWGAIIVALSLYILRIEHRHKKERDEWKELMEKLMDRQHDSIINNTNILSALKTLLEHRK